MAIKNRVYLIILSFLFIIIISNTNNVLSLEATGNFSIGNIPPPAFTNFSIQDGASSWDNTSLDTHDIIPNILWINGTDNNDDAISTHICIANTTTFIGQFIAGNSDNCIYSTTVAAGTYTLNDIPNLKFNSTNTTYYITLIPDDGADNGTELNETIYFLDSLPVASNFNITQSHSQTPIVSWSVVDADDGSQDKWPADSLTHYILIGNNSNVTAYFTSMSADNTSTTISSAIPWGEPGADWANRTINVTIGVDDGYLNYSTYNYTNYTTSFTLYDYLPHITAVRITHHGDNYAQSCQSGGGFCALTPEEHNNVTLAVKLNVTDTDNDCSGSNHEAWIMFCLNSSGYPNCDESGYNYSWEINSVASGATNECIFTFSTNKTASDGTMEFFRPPGMYKLHLNVTSQAGERTNRSNSNASWEYGTTLAVNYSTALILGGGNPTLDQWNDGTNRYTMTNWANALLVLEWNASDPTSGLDNWALNGTDFAIDDDNSFSSSVNLTRVFLNGTTKYFNHSTGLERCLAWGCNDLSTNETLDTYYHIYPPLGLQAGTYNTTITITLSSK